MANFLTLLIPVVLAVLFGWLASRAWRARRALIKWPGVVLAGLLTLVFTAVTVVAIVGYVKLYSPHPNPVANVKVSGTPDQIARGQKLAQICIGCHTTHPGQLPLDGGPNFAEGGPPVGTLYPPNLTPGGPLKDWSDGEIIRAIREGVHKDGRALIIMPSQVFHNMSDADVQAVVAYLRSQPAVANTMPDNSFNVIGALFLGAGMAPTSVQPPITQPVVAPQPGTTEYGLYLVNIAGCRDCHGTNLSGGVSGGGGAPAPNLTAIVPKWTQEQFVQTIRTGKDPTGHTLNPDEMPWKDYSAAFDDNELKDIYSYLSKLQPVATQK